MLISRETQNLTEFVPLPEHSARICRFLYRDASYFDESGIEVDEPHSTDDFWENIAEPLRIAASIKVIDTEIEIIGPGDSAMCSQAWEYESKLADLTSLYTTEITRFMWVWIAFEELSNRICNGLVGRGVTGRAIHYIKTDIFTLNLSGLKRVEKLALKLCSEEVFQAASKAAKNSKTEDYMFIHLCREARNDFFHSHNVSLEPDDYGENDLSLNNDHRVTYPSTLSRLTLFSLQLILMVYFKKSDLKTGWFMDSIGVPQNLALRDALQFIHLSDQSGANQLNLEI